MPYGLGMNRSANDFYNIPQHKSLKYTTLQKYNYMFPAYSDVIKKRDEKINCLNPKYFSKVIN